MKLATRYLLRHFFQPWAYIFSGFSIIAILVDLFSTFGDFVETGTSTPAILLYYLVLLPTYFPYLFPISILLALLYALWNLGKNAEIIALRACGFSLLQIAAPFLAIGFTASVLLFFLNEAFNPWATYWTRQFRNLQGHPEAAQPFLARNLTYKNVPGHRLWSIASFDVRPAADYAMQGILLIQQRPDGSDEFRLHAARARWMNGHWWFGDAIVHYFDTHNNPLGPPEELPSFDTAEISEKPGDFLNEIKDATNNERSSRDILAFIRTHDISPDARTRALVDVHNRLASPWMCLIAVLLGIPFGMRTARRGMGMGILLALLAFFGYYVFMAVALAVGKDRELYAWINATFSDPSFALSCLGFLAGWLPAIFFLALALVLLHRQR